MMNERGMDMKKLLCLLLALCLLPACAFAVDIDDFNTYAYVFDVPELGESVGESNGYVFYESDGCIISLKEENGEINSVVINGDGISFMAYAMAAIMVIDSDSSHLSDNAGQFISMFMMNRNKEKETYGYLAAGGFFVISKNDKGYIFLAGK